MHREPAGTSSNPPHTPKRPARRNARPIASLCLCLSLYGCFGSADQDLSQIGDEAKQGAASAIQKAHDAFTH